MALKVLPAGAGEPACSFLGTTFHYLKEECTLRLSFFAHLSVRYFLFFLQMIELCEQLGKVNRDLINGLHYGSIRGLNLRLYPTTYNAVGNVVKFKTSADCR